MFVDTLMRHCIKKDHDFLNVFEPFWKTSGAVLHSTSNPCQRKTFYFYSFFLYSAVAGEKFHRKDAPEVVGRTQPMSKAIKVKNRKH